jgi:glutamyl-tRNA synthetase
MVRTETSAKRSDAVQRQVVTRFAPSPTGYLHIGGARTALFSYLFARHHGGQFRLRIEDTDRERSIPSAIDAIIDGLRWLNLDWDGDVAYQFAQAGRHAEVARALLASGQAYLCFASPEELTHMRESARAAGQPMRYDGRWRDRDPATAPAGAKPVIRLKAPLTGETIIEDEVQGRVVVQNEQLDDMVLLRSDGTPTYMLAVVVDDYDMGVTHVIRGDDHLNNAFRQLQLIRALGWPEPVYAHIPLIHGADGQKLSKRHGAVGLHEFQNMGILPEALENYLLRLGWSHGDDEIISRAQAIDWFGLGAIGQGPARLDPKKLDSVNAHYLREAAPERLVSLIAPDIEQNVGATLSDRNRALLMTAMPELAARAKTTHELAQGAAFLVRARPVTMDENARKALNDASAQLMARVIADLDGLAEWTVENLDGALKTCAANLELGLGKFLPVLRAALCGSTQAPGVSHILFWLGKQESLARLNDQLETKKMSA